MYATNASTSTSSNLNLYILDLANFKIYHVLSHAADYSCLADGKEVPPGELFEIFQEGKNFTCLCPRHISRDPNGSRQHIKCMLASDTSVCKLPGGKTVGVGKEFGKLYKGYNLLCICPSSESAKLICRHNTGNVFIIFFFLICFYYLHQIKSNICLLKTCGVT